MSAAGMDGSKPTSPQSPTAAESAASSKKSGKPKSTSSKTKDAEQQPDLRSLIKTASDELSALYTEQYRLTRVGERINTNFKPQEKLEKATKALAEARKALGERPKEQFTAEKEYDPFAKELSDLEREVKALQTEDLSVSKMRHTVVALTPEDVSTLKWDHYWGVAKPFLFVLGKVFVVGGSIALGVHNFTTTTGLALTITATSVGGVAVLAGVVRVVAEWWRHHPLEAQILQLKHRIDLQKYTKYGYDVLTLTPEKFQKLTTEELEKRYPAASKKAEEDKSTAEEDKSKAEKVPINYAVQFYNDIRRLNHYAAVKVALDEMVQAKDNPDVLIGKIAALQALTGLDKPNVQPAIPLDPATKQFIEKQIEKFQKLSMRQNYGNTSK